MRVKVLSKLALAAVVLLLFAGLLYGHTKKPWPVPAAAKARKNPVAATAESLAAGAKLFQRNCAVCHGETGDGKGPWQNILTTQPSDFADAHMMAEHTDGELFWKISTGREQMPAFEKKLSEQERWQLVNYLRTFARSKGKK